MHNRTMLTRFHCMMNCLQVSFFLLLFFVTYLKGKIPGKVKRMKLADPLIKLWPGDIQRNIIPLLFICVCLQEATLLLLSQCVFQFSKESSVFNAGNIICTTEIPYLSYLAGPQCKCSFGLKDCANFFYIYRVVKYVSECAYMCACTCMYEHKM